VNSGSRLAPSEGNDARRKGVRALNREAQRKSDKRDFKGGKREREKIRHPDERKKKERVLRGDQECRRAGYMKRISININAKRYMRGVLRGGAGAGKTRFSKRVYACFGIIVRVKGGGNRK